MSVSIHAQTWRAKIETSTLKGHHLTRTLTMRPYHKISIISAGTHSYNIPVRYTGAFLGVSSDSIRIDLLMGRSNIQKPEYLKGKSFPGREDYYRGNLSVALSDVSYIHYMRLTENTEDFFSASLFLGILGSLAAIVITPLFCINYKDMKFNACRYKNWALGGAIGLASSVTLVFTVNKIDDRKFHFKPDDTDKNVKIWSFKND
ncbi:MAG: hypothetical protein JXR66_05400 [Bacteroidales bacterium]|nr:hypothetical protein [Bacteroidales bacterium]